MSKKKDGELREFSVEHISYMIRASVVFGILSHSEADRLWRELYRINRGEDALYDSDLLWRKQELLLLPDVISSVILSWQEAHTGHKRWDRSLIAKDILQRTLKASYDRKIKYWHWVHHEWSFNVPNEITEETKIEPIAGRAMGDGYPK